MYKVKYTSRILLVGLGLLLAVSGANAALVPFSLQGNVDGADAGNIFNVSVSDTITATGSFDDSLLSAGGTGAVTGILITVGSLTFTDAMEAFGGAEITLTTSGALSGLTYEANEGANGALANFDSFFLSFTGSAFNGPKLRGQPTELSIAGSWDANTFTVVPVPAAVWLFGSGLLGLAGVARRKAS